MKINSGKALLICTLLGASSSLLAAASDFSSRSRRPGWPDKPGKKEVWSCTAYDAAGTGLFYIGLDENRWTARSKALETCYRFVDSCTVSCQRKL